MEQVAAVVAWPEPGPWLGANVHCWFNDRVCAAVVTEVLDDTHVHLTIFPPNRQPVPWSVMPRLDQAGSDRGERYGWFWPRFPQSANGSPVSGNKP